MAESSEIEDDDDDLRSTKNKYSNNSTDGTRKRHALRDSSSEALGGSEESKSP